MSVTISAIPFLLISSIFYSIKPVTEGLYELSKEISDQKLNIQNDKIHINSDEFENLLNKDFETPILDKNLLIKTLEEHGADNIIEDGEEVYCQCDNFHFEFYRNQNSPYYMRINYNSDTELEDIVKDINDEYRANAQEISYNKIKERLEAQNLTIDEEEIYDDNTIVLTVNLE